MSYSESRSPAGVTPAFKQSRLWLRARNSWLGELVRAIRRCRHELVGLTRFKHPKAADVQELCKSILALQNSHSTTVEASEDSEVPIFLLSTSWRSGSTLLQRILVTDPDLLLWGEPLGEMSLVSRLTEMVSLSISDRNLTLWQKQSALTSVPLAESWIANLYPSAEDFRLALRAVFDRWLCKPARDQGFVRWGFKEVRIGATEAVFLNWLYPKAKFLVISRHPYHCYRSLNDSGWGQVYDRYPDVIVDSAAAFAWHWNRIAVSWFELPVGFPIRRIKYEDLIARRIDFRELESWLGIRIDESAALSASVGKTATRETLSWCERLIISHEAAPGMRALGYSKRH
jgi:Sulfotransferase family